MNKEKMYSLAVRKRQNKNDFFWEHDKFEFVEYKISNSNRYWFADPFLFERAGVCYVFYEAYDLIRRKGVIGYSVIAEDSEKLQFNIAIDQPFHLSFPNLFEHNGEVYMIPETCETDSITLFRAEEFPMRWVEEKQLLTAIFACDTLVLSDKDDRRFLLSSEMYRERVPNDTYASCWVQNCIYPIHDAFKINTSERFVVAEGDYGIRNAGKPLEYRGNILRVGQDCRNKEYGRGLVFFEINSFYPYQERKILEMDYLEFEKHIKRLCETSLLGVHTYNNTEKYEIIDFSQLRKVSVSVQLFRGIIYWYLKIRHFAGKNKRRIINLIKHSLHH